MDPLPERPSSFRDRILRRVNALEQGLERYKDRPWHWPVWLAGSMFLAMLLLISNLVAVLRWPFASSRIRSPSASGAVTSGVASQTGRDTAGGDIEYREEPNRDRAESEGAGAEVADRRPHGTGAPDEPLPVGHDALERLLSRQRVVLVDFWAPWCGPCLMMEGAVERLAAEVGPGCQVATVNTTHHHDVASLYQVRGLPTLILFLDGEEVARHAGAVSYNELRQWIVRNTDRVFS